MKEKDRNRERKKTRPTIRLQEQSIKALKYYVNLFRIMKGDHLLILVKIGYDDLK